MVTCVCQLTSGTSSGLFPLPPRQSTPGVSCRVLLQLPRVCTFCYFLSSLTPTTRQSTPGVSCRLLLQPTRHCTSGTSSLQLLQHPATIARVRRLACCLLLGPVVKVSAPRAAGLGSIPAKPVVCVQVQSYQGLPVGAPVAALPGAWRYRVRSGFGWPGVSIL